jgi:hypothetical protein
MGLLGLALPHTCLLVWTLSFSRPTHYMGLEVAIPHNPRINHYSSTVADRNRHTSTYFVHTITSQLRLHLTPGPLFTPLKGASTKEILFSLQQPMHLCNNVHFVSYRIPY